MVFYLDGKPADTEFKGRTFRHRPAPQHATNFQPKIRVEMSGLVLLNHKTVLPFILTLPPRWFGGLVKTMLFLVRFQITLSSLTCWWV